MSSPSGWYSDPQREGRTRYWDGLRWGVTDEEYHAQSQAATSPLVPVSFESPAAEPEPPMAAVHRLETAVGMSRLQCDLCSGTEFTKEDDFFVCDFCRTKYSLEAARKMMIQGTVEVVGTVQVDRSSEAENLIRLSKTALEHENAEEAYAYANRALEIDSSNWEAWRCKGAAATGLATYEDLRIPELMGATASALRSAPQDRREELQSEWATELRKRAAELYGASSWQLSRFAWTSMEWERHVERCKDILRLLDMSYQWRAQQDAPRDSIRIASELLAGIRYKDDDGRRISQNLTSQDELQMRTLVATKTIEVRRSDPSYVPPQPKRAQI